MAPRLGQAGEAGSPPEASPEFRVADHGPPFGGAPPARPSGVPARPAVSVTLSEAVDPASADASRLTLEVVGGAAVAGAVAVDGAVVTSTPAASLPFGAALRATLHAGVRDLAGSALAADTT